MITSPERSAKFLDVASRSMLSFHSVCLSVWMSDGHSATYSLPRLIDHNPCKPFWVPYLPYFRCQRENMQNFPYFQRQPFNAYSCHCERDVSRHMTCFCLSLCLSVCSHNFKTTQPNFNNHFACCLRAWLRPPLATLRCHVLPVLWITSCFHIVALRRVMCILKRR